MITLVLTYRNRDLESVKQCLDSLANQVFSEFVIYLVDYGSNKKYSFGLERVVKDYTFIELIKVPTQHQLWNKSRAINIALKKCTTDYFIMGDIDLLYHPNFTEQAISLIQNYDAVYFQYGFLSELESKKHKDFKDYKVDFFGNEEGTGTNIFRTEALKSINGYDEFYHGWGAEDTDVHLRLKKAGYKIYYYDEEVYLKHIYHPKFYRSKKNKEPFHNGLEKINHKYMLQQDMLNVTKANLKNPWGSLPTHNQTELINKTLDKLVVSNKIEEIDALVVGVLPQLSKPLEIIIVKDKEVSVIKNTVKKILKKKHIRFYNLDTINNKILEQIISYQRLALYRYIIDRDSKKITLKIVPFEN